MTAMWIKISVIGFALSVVALLILQRVPEPERRIQVIEQNGEVRLDLRRGGTISTGSEARAILSIDGILVGLSENTDIRFDRLFETEVRLFIPRGRVAVDARSAPLGSVSVITDRVISAGNEVWTLVNYDFAERVSILPINDAVQLFVNGVEQPSLVLESAEVSELEPYAITYTAFDLSSSSEADFYAWFNASVAD